MLFGGWAKEQQEEINNSGGEGVYYKNLAESYRKSWIKEQENLQHLKNKLTIFYESL